MSRLTAKQARFVDEYLVDLNATAAARRAGYTHNNPSEIGYGLLQKTSVQAAISAAQRERSARTGITADRVIQEIARVAFSNLRDVVEWGPDGVRLRPSGELSLDVSAAVAEVSETTTPNGGSIRTKMHNKIAALEQLAKHVGLYADHSPEDRTQQIVVYLPDNGR